MYYFVMFDTPNDMSPDIELTAKSITVGRKNNQTKNKYHNNAFKEQMFYGQEETEIGQSL